MNAPKPPGGPSKRRRIAGEVKPGDAAAAPVAPSGPKPKLPKPKLPKPPRAGRAGDTPMQPAAPTTSDLPAAPPRSDAIRVSRPKPSVAFVTLLVLAIASLGFGAYGVWRGVDERRSNSIVEARAGATDAAASAIETIYTYEYDNLDEHTRKSRATMTPKLAKSVGPTTRALKQLAPLRKTRVKAVVRYAAAKSVVTAARHARRRSWFSSTWPESTPIARSRQWRRRAWTCSWLSARASGSSTTSTRCRHARQGGQ